MFITGYATEDEVVLLLERGWEVEDAAKMGRVVGEEAGSMMTPPMQPSPSNTQAIAVFIDASVAEALTILEGHGCESAGSGGNISEKLEGRPTANAVPASVCRFELIEQRAVDEYPSDGLRMVLLSNNDNDETKRRIEANRGGGTPTGVLRHLGLQDLRAGDIVEVQAKIVERWEPQRKKV